ncbi:hypothetical protein PROFUN_15072 [Planoprotostelium fungivorum]|uniref:Uncharacterized protein n=1 Tax=Planoprotostelium fungivorum TaxID=1890364 RepID=A0A2P6MTB2_9EUKA|nr:hypothetical protein PROFUN_15072 [Planoprotostelium fungivorum]
MFADNIPTFHRVRKCLLVSMTSQIKGYGLELGYTRDAVEKFKTQSLVTKMNPGLETQSLVTKMNPGLEVFDLVNCWPRCGGRILTKPHIPTHSFAWFLYQNSQHTDIQSLKAEYSLVRTSRYMYWHGIREYVSRNPADFKIILMRLRTSRYMYQHSKETCVSNLIPCQYMLIDVSCWSLAETKYLSTMSRLVKKENGPDATNRIRGRILRLQSTHRGKYRKTDAPNNCPNYNGRSFPEFPTFKKHALFTETFHRLFP